MMGKLRLVSRARLKHDAVRGMDVLLAPESVVELNVQGAEVLRLCDGTRTLDEIVQALSERYPGATVGPDVSSFVARLVGRGLLEEV
jgi:pyrroloquinoline quinone biosynthesis protein D